MYTWEVSTSVGRDTITADKVIVSNSGVLMFFDEIANGNLLVTAYREWMDCCLTAD